MDQINQEIEAWIWNQGIPKSKIFWNPVDAHSLLTSCGRFSTWCRQNSLMLASAAVTVAHAADCCGPHIDTPPARYKLSWPVSNTKNTWNCWYRCTVPDPDTEINIWGGTIYKDPGQLLEIYRREVTRPALIDAGVIHDVMAGPGAQWPRIVLQCQLLKEPLTL